jgi:threonine/homoserine efflux transporter RhtA
LRNLNECSDATRRRPVGMAALKLIGALLGFLPRRVKLVGQWLSHEVKGSVRKRRPGIAWLSAVAGMVVGTGNNVLLLKSGATGMPAFVTGFLTDVAASATLWAVVRPKIRQIEWPVKRAALIFGVSSSVSIWSGQEALHHMPYAMVAVLALMVGPMTAALASGRRHWQIVAWVCVSATGASLLYGVAAWHLSAMGMLSIVLNGAMYWVMARIFTGLGRREEGTANDAVFVASALSGLVTVPILGVAFLLAHGPTVVGHHSAWGTAGALGVGALATITAVCASAAWKRGLSISAHAQLQPAKPVLALMWGLVAGQKPAKIGLNTIDGYLLVCLGAGAVGRLFVQAKRNAQQRDSSDLVGATMTE